LRPMSKGIALEAFSFTTTEAEGAALYLLVTDAGFEANSAGVKAYLLWKAGVHAGPQGAGDEAEGGDEPLTENVRRILDALERNPEVTNLAIKKGAEIFGSLVKRVIG